MSNDFTEKKVKVMTVVGTRPEVIRLSMVIKRLNESEAVDHVLVHTGQNFDYELNEIFFKDLDIDSPAYYLDAAGEDTIDTIGQVIIAVNKVIKKERPDALLILGDTNSCLSAIVAKKHKIPIFHMEAGNRSFDQRVPEEANRKIVDSISDINLPYSDISREHLISEGVHSAQIIKTGSPMKEVVNSTLPKVDDAAILSKNNIEKGKYFLVSSHRDENISSNKFYNFVALINKLDEKYKLPIIVTTHPKTRNRIAKEKISFSSNVVLSKPFGYIEYLGLQRNAKAVLSDSGTISEESSIMGFPALNLREAHERPEAMEEGTVMMVGMDINRVLQGLSILGEDKRPKPTPIVRDYDDDIVSEKVLRIILSYIDYVNINVWKKADYFNG